jgi:hypothetical protein
VFFHFSIDPLPEKMTGLLEIARFGKPDRVFRHEIENLRDFCEDCLTRKMVGKVDDIAHFTVDLVYRQNDGFQLSPRLGKRLEGIF